MAREKFERVKPHVNIGTIGHVDHGISWASSTTCIWQLFQDDDCRARQPGRMQPRDDMFIAHYIQGSEASFSDMRRGHSTGVGGRLLITVEGRGGHEGGRVVRRRESFLLGP